jgi:hypothetical protein
MWTTHRRSSTTHSVRSQQLGVVFALLACAGLAACTATEPPSPAPSADANTADTVSPLPESGDLDPGTYRVTGFTVPFEVTVPEGWETDGGWAVTKEANPEEAVFVIFYTAAYVPTDACGWQGTLVKSDASARVLADALAAQTSTTTTPPVEVTVGAYSGLEFDHSAESDVDITDCHGKKICVQSEMPFACTRWYSDVNEHETERVMDLNGEVAIFAVGQFTTVSPSLTKEARAVFDSIEFAPSE